MMKTRYSWLLVTAGMLGLAGAQMPAGGGNGVPSSFDVSGAGAKPQVDDPARRGETPPPQLLGMEIPLMDPSSDTVSYNGGYFDVGNNAAVRARFEKYLQQMPDDSAESKRYRSLINKILQQTQKSSRDKRYVIGSEALINIGRGLYEADNYPGDGGQSGTLASTIVSALDAQRVNLKRDRQNEKYSAELNRLVKQADTWQNDNVHRKSGIASSGGKKNGKSDAGGDINTLKVANTMAQVADIKAVKTANTTKNEANITLSKINYQSVLVSLLLSRRFDHAVIGSRVYRHIFRDGDTKLNLDKKSKANEIFSGGVGMPPTVNAIDSIASNARREVDQSIEAVHSMLAQNKLGEATQHLIEAVAIGEYMQSVATFPVESRRRIARYWNLRKRALSALNSRDYATVDEVAAKMKEMDEDFDDSMLRSYSAGKKRQSDLAIRNARKALLAGNEEEFNKYIQEAGIIWPQNPNLDKGAELIAKFDEGDDLKEEFRTLYKRKDFRTIAKERERFKLVAMDPELAKQYEEVVTVVMKMDGMLEQLRSAAQQDATLGPCMAYEKITQWQEEDEHYAEDHEMLLARKEFESKAHDFVQALWDAAACEERREFGSALSCYYRAQCKYPHSEIAKKGISRVTDIIVKATYD